MITTWIEKMLATKNLTPTRENLDEFVLDRMRYTVSYCAESSNFYRDLLKGSGIGSITDFKRLPMTCADDIIEKPNYFLCISQSEILRSYVVDTLDGKSKQISFSLSELEHIVSAIATFFRSIGITGGTKVGILFPPEYEWGIPDLLVRAAKECGADPGLIDQNDMDSQMSAIESIQPELLVGSAQQLFFLTALREKGAKTPPYLKGIVPCHGCVPYLFSEKAKRMVKESWGTKLYEHFGITEMGFNVAMGCDEGGWLHINEADVYAETVDPAGAPLGEGEEGELLLTSLSAKSMPIIRYRTGYLASMAEPGCSCGDSLTRRLKIRSYLGSDEDLLSRPLVFRPF